MLSVWKQMMLHVIRVEQKVMWTQLPVQESTEGGTGNGQQAWWLLHFMLEVVVHNLRLNFPSKKQKVPSSGRQAKSMQLALVQVTQICSHPIYSSNSAPSFVSVVLPLSLTESYTNITSVNDWRRRQCISVFQPLDFYFWSFFVMGLQMKPHSQLWGPPCCCWYFGRWMRTSNDMWLSIRLCPYAVKLIGTTKKWGW